MKPCGCQIKKQFSHGSFFAKTLIRTVALELQGIKTTCDPLIPIWAIVLLSIGGAIIALLIGILIWVKRRDDYEELA